MEYIKKEELKDGDVFVVKEPTKNKTELEIWLENTKSLVAFIIYVKLPLSAL